MTAVELIARKRDGGELSGDELAGLVHAYLADEIDEAQMAALLMAGVLRGFSREEAVALTEVLVDSGERLDLGSLPAPTVDKHSTGGVGDTTTLVVAPLLAAAGCQVAKLSGRGLGHTGGTLDKLEAIPGLDVDLEPDRLRAQVASVGLGVAAAGPRLAPADRRLYALRDVTATVESPALIAASVMSKKLAGGAEHVLLDVKVGEGAFVADLPAARDLAELCVTIGASHGRRTGALLTAMDEPLGDAVGNALEVAAAIEVLRGGGDGRLREVSIALAAATLELTGLDGDAAVARVTHLLNEHRALEKFRDLISAQGGATAVVDKPWNILPIAAVIRDWRPGAGIVHSVPAQRVGEIARGLGAGRTRQGTTVDPAVGLEILVRTGDPVADGEVAGRVHAATPGDAEVALAALDDAVRLGTGHLAPRPLLLDRVGLPAPS